MTIRPLTVEHARACLGAAVWYTVPDSEQAVLGRITWVQGRLIWVHFPGEAESKALRARDLELA